MILSVSQIMPRRSLVKEFIDVVVRFLQHVSKLLDFAFKLIESFFVDVTAQSIWRLEFRLRRR